MQLEDISPIRMLKKLLGWEILKRSFQRMCLLRWVKLNHLGKSLVNHFILIFDKVKDDSNGNGIYSAWFLMVLLGYDLFHCRIYRVRGH